MQQLEGLDITTGVFSKVNDTGILLARTVPGVPVTLSAEKVREIFLDGPVNTQTNLCRPSVRAFSGSQVVWGPATKDGNQTTNIVGTGLTFQFTPNTQWGTPYTLDIPVYFNGRPNPSAVIRLTVVHSDRMFPVFFPGKDSSPGTGTTDIDRLGLSNADKCLGGGGAKDPEWVTVLDFDSTCSSNGTCGDQNDIGDGHSAYRLLEGTLKSVKISNEDNRLSHTSRDVDMVVEPDGPFQYLISTFTHEKELGSTEMGAEWEDDKLSRRFWPEQGDRVSMFGYWILDCGHKQKEGVDEHPPGFHTEIHPPVLLASHKSRIVHIPENWDGTNVRLVAGAPEPGQSNTANRTRPTRAGRTVRISSSPV